NGVSIGPERIKQLLKEWTAYNRLFIDVRADHSADDLDRIVSYSDIVLWCIRPQDVSAALQVLRTVERSVPRLRQKVCVVWILNHDAPAPPYVRGLHEFAARDFKTYSGQGDGNGGMWSGPGGRPELFVVNIRSTARANRGTGTARMAQLKS